MQKINIKNQFSYWKLIFLIICDVIHLSDKQVLVAKNNSIDEPDYIS